MDESDVDKIESTTLGTDLLEDICKYLRFSQLDDNSEECQLMKDTDIGANAEKQFVYKGDWEDKDHNQFRLFDLAKIIDDFDIDDNTMEQLTFREHLVISSFLEDPTAAMPVAVGGLCLDIQKVLGKEPAERKKPEITPKMVKYDLSNEQHYKQVDESAESLLFSLIESGTTIETTLDREENKFIVHLSSQFDYEENNGGSRLISWIDKNFHTIEERRYEYVSDAEAPKGLNERVLYSGLQKDFYYIHCKNTKDKVSENKYYSLEKMRDYIGEGASFLLMRYLAVTRYFGEFELSTLYINGDACRDLYKCTGVEGGIVNGKRIDICRIYRKIIEENGLEHRSISVLTLQGQLLKHEWFDCPFVIHVNPLQDITNEKPVGNERLLLEKTWEHDIKLFSRYLDKKTACQYRLSTYMLENNELSDLLADYMQSILQMKPEDVLDYSINHFLFFAPQFWPHEEYFDGEQDGGSVDEAEGRINI